MDVVHCPDRDAERLSTVDVIDDSWATNDGPTFVSCSHAFLDLVAQYRAANLSDRTPEIHDGGLELCSHATEPSSTLTVMPSRTDH